MKMKELANNEIMNVTGGRVCYCYCWDGKGGGVCIGNTTHKGCRNECNDREYRVYECGKPEESLLTVDLRWSIAALTP